MTVTLALTNATGRQSASLTRAASAVGFHVRAHVATASHSPLVAAELAGLPNVTVLNGNLASKPFLEHLLEGADVAFINTTAFDDEETVGKQCADLAVSKNLKHVVYSSMPDHKFGDKEGKGWFGLPQWKEKWQVEEYFRRTMATRATYVHTGIYHNNFTSLPYPLFCMREVQLPRPGEWGTEGLANQADPPIDGLPKKSIGFEWCAPFPPDVKLPWLDCEHDFGPAVLQIFKQGPEHWGGRRVPIAFSFMTPNEVCAAFSRGLKYPARYVQGPITVSVPVPSGYRNQLQALEKLLGDSHLGGLAAPYWWDGLMDIERKEDESERHAILRVARKLWPGRRGMEEYAREAFKVEERLNGRTWMEEEEESLEPVEEDGVPDHELEEARPL